VPGNSLASIAAALDADVDAVEVDVRLSPDGAFVLSHDVPATRALPRLADAVDLVRGRAFLNVDLKVSGCEDALARELRTLGATRTSLVSTLDRASARRLKEADARLAVSLSYPHDYAGAHVRSFLPGATTIGAAIMRAALPRRLPAWVRETRADALTLWFGVTSARVVGAADALGVPVIAWTVNDRADAAALRSAGVRGITTDDPRGIAP
jgi:glycerophosphoryl diester phosphodiesterase